MNIRKIKTRCIKQSIDKCEGVCKTYSAIATQYALILSKNEEVKSFKTNMLLEGLGLDVEYTTDFVIKKTDGNYMVRECIDRTLLLRPKNAKLLDESKNYWRNHGVIDWGIITNAK